ncbi:helix-turn-helix domain-containing protein [Limosilactobacillus allomucosae]|uniref:helix-turn-helix domain-containing protein n=1 Tax=Limosilactobacillus allomucosae TaxID=3142938 RepID=UPI003264A038
MDSFQSRLRQALSESNMTQSELSRRSGIGRNSISDYVKGKYKASQNNLGAMARALNVDEGWLMGVTDKKERFDARQPGSSAAKCESEETKSVNELVDEMRSYHGIEISDAQRASMKAILKAYLDTELNKDNNQDK